MEPPAGGEEFGRNKFRQNEGARSITFNWSCWQAGKSPGEANLDKMKEPGVLHLSGAAGRQGRVREEQIDLESFRIDFKDVKCERHIHD